VNIATDLDFIVETIGGDKLTGFSLYCGGSLNS
jgi:hypothetical protein